MDDLTQFHYTKPGTKNTWDVITDGDDDDKFIQRATQATVDTKADGTQVIKKKHIVRNDFLRSIEEYI